MSLRPLTDDARNKDSRDLLGIPGTLDISNVDADIEFEQMPLARRCSLRDHDADVFGELLSRRPRQLDLLQGQGH